MAGRCSYSGSSIKLYKKWALAFDQDLSESTDYLIPKIIAYYYNKYLKNFDTPILEAGTGLVGKYL